MSAWTRHMGRGRSCIRNRRTMRNRYYWFSLFLTLAYTFSRFSHIHFNRFEEYFHEAFFFSCPVHFQSIFLLDLIIISKHIEILHLLGSKASKDSACRLKSKICILKWGSNINVINICRGKKTYSISTDWCQLLDIFSQTLLPVLFPMFSRPILCYHPTLSSGSELSFGKFAKALSFRLGRNSCSHLSGKFEVWTALSKLTMTKTKAKTKTKTKRNSCSHLSGKFEHQLCQKSKLKWNPKRASTIHKMINQKT